MFERAFMFEASQTTVRVIPRLTYYVSQWSRLFGVTGSERDQAIHLFIRIIFQVDSGFLRAKALSKKFNFVEF